MVQILRPTDLQHRQYHKNLCHLLNPTVSSHVMLYKENQRPLLLHQSSPQIRLPCFLQLLRIHLTCIILSAFHQNMAYPHLPYCSFLLILHNQLTLWTTLLHITMHLQFSFSLIFSFLFFRKFFLFFLNKKCFLFHKITLTYIFVNCFITPKLFLCNMAKIIFILFFMENMFFLNPIDKFCFFVKIYAINIK